MKRYIAVALAALLAALSLLPAPAQAFDEYWGFLNSSDESTLLDLVHGGSTFVAVGKKGSIVTSSDGIFWVARESGVQTDLKGVAYGNGLFIAVGKESVASEDGTSWRTITIPTTGTVNAVLFAAGQFTVADDTGKAYSSTDGKTWSVAKDFSSPFNRVQPNFHSIAYANGLYVLTLSNGDIYTYGTRDRTGAIGWGVTCARVLYLNGQFLQPCQELVVHGTSDASRWERRELNTWGTLKDLVYDGRRYVGVGESGLVVTSTDTKTWTVQDKPRQAPSYHALEYVNGLYVAVGSFGKVWTSKDAATWVEIYNGNEINLHTVSVGGGQVVAAGAGGGVLHSPEPFNWRWVRKDSGTGNPLNGSTYGKDRFVAVGSYGTITTSEDGMAWTRQQSVENSDLRAVAFGQERFVAVGEAGGRGLVLTSPDGLSWSRVETDLPPLRAVTAGEDGFVAVGASGLVVTSPDGSTWSQGTAPSDVVLNGVAYGGGRYLAVGVRRSGGGAALTSTDGVTWTAVPGAGEYILNGVTYQADRFIFVGMNGTVGFSTDGQRLTTYAEVVPINLRAITRAGEYLVAVGDGGGVRVWRLKDLANSTMTVDRASVALGQEVKVSVKLLTSTDRTESGAKVMLIQEPVLGEVQRPERATDYRGETEFTWKATKPGTVTLRAILNDGTYLPVSVKVQVAAECGKRFADVPAGHPACQAIEQLSELGVINGYPQGFLPEQGLTRAELATMFVRALKLDAEPGVALPFTDVSGHWAASGGYIQTAVKAGAFGGMPDGTFQPDGPVTRAQLAKVVAAGAGLQGTGKAAGYSDITADAWYAGWVADARGAKLVGAEAPYPVFAAAIFDGDRPATRAEAAMMLANLLAGR